MGIESLKLPSFSNTTITNVRNSLKKYRENGTELQKEWWRAIEEEFKAQHRAYEGVTFKSNIWDNDKC